MSATVAAAELPEVTIVVVTCNGRALLAECLASLREQDYPARRIEILVYDNGSSDGTVEWLASDAPAVRVIEARDNQGFAAPNNRAVKQASSSLVCLVNNDMRFARTFLHELVAARAATGATCVGARILSADGNRIEFDGGTMNFYGHGAPWRHGADASRHAAETAPRDSLFASGGAMLVERDAFVAAGGFDESYFAYFEDVDLGWRLWTLGERCAHAPAARAFHREHASEHLLGPGRRMAMLERNALCSVWKNYEPERARRMFGCALALASERARLDPDRRAACEQGVLEAIALLPAMEERRRALAARRRRSDRDVVGLFREPWRPAIGGDTYRDRQRALAATFGADELLPAESDDTAGFAREEATCA